MWNPGPVNCLLWVLADTCALFSTTHQMTEPVFWLLILSPCSLTLYLFSFFLLIWNQNQLETTAEKSGLLGCLLDERLASYTSELPQHHPPLPATGPFDLFQSWKQKFERKSCSRAGYPSWDVSIQLQSFLFTSKPFFSQISADQRITSALFTSGGGPDQTLTLILGCLLVSNLHLKHEVDHRRLSPLKAVQLWLRSRASCWCFTVCSLVKSYSIKATETCLSSRKCVARRPHHMSLAAGCLFCFGSQNVPRCRNRLITNGCLSGKAVNGSLNPGRCFSQMLH